MFVLNVPENFFYEIFECDDTGCTSVFVYNDCNAFFLLHERLHQFLSRHGFCDLGNGADICFPVDRTFKEIR